MKYSEIINLVNEAWETQVYDNEILRNPSKDKIIELIKNSNQQLVKGIVDNKQVYIWDAYEYHHNQVRKHLGLESYIDFILALSGEILDREAVHPGHMITSNNFAIQMNSEPKDFNGCKNFTRSIGILPNEV